MSLMHHPLHSRPRRRWVRTTVVAAAMSVAVGSLAGSASSAPATITAVGTTTSNAGSGITTLSVSPAHLGDLLVLGVKVNSSSITASSVSGGGASTWSRAEGPYTGYAGHDVELWRGTVTTTGPSTITATFSGSVSAIKTDLVAQEFQASSGASTSWSVDTGAGISNVSSTTVTFPQLTPTGTGELYFGYIPVANSASAGSTPGFTYATTADADVAAYDTNVTATVQPTATQAPAGVSGGLAVLITASGSPPPVPTVTAVGPSSGPTTGGTPVTVTGTGFSGATVVKFGTTAGTGLVVNSPTSISITSPAEAAATVDVTVTTGGGTSVVNAPADHFTFTVPSAAISAVGTLTSKFGTALTTLAVTPHAIGDVLSVFAEAGTTGASVTSPSGGGVTTWTKGVGFTGTGGVDTEIWFGKVTATGAQTITFAWSGSIAGHTTEYGAQEFSDGLGPSTVWALDKSGTSNGPSSTSVPFPNLSPTGSGELYFGYAEVANNAGAGSTAGFTYAVTTNGNAALYDPNVSGTVAPTATQSPAGVSTAVGVLISASTGAPPPVPTVTAVSPSSGPTTGVTPVTVTGTGFTGATVVKFGTTAGTGLVVNSTTSLSITSPAEAASTVDVTVTTPGGTSVVNAPADQFTFNPPPVPTVTAVSPSSGPTTGGTPVTVTGTGFTGATAVKFGITAGTGLVVNSSTSISITSPAEAASTVDVTVTTPGGTSLVNAPADQFTYNVPPVVITPVGTFTSKLGTAVTTLAVAPHTIGDVLAVFAEVGTTGATVSSVSGGGVTTWTKGAQFIGTGGVDTEIWFGKVTATGTSTATFAWSSSIAGHITEYGAQEFTAGLGATTVWALDKSGTSNGPSSTTVPYPSLTPSRGGELYFGYAEVVNTAGTGSTAGFTYVVTANGNSALYDPNVTTTVAPTATQSPAGLSTAVGVLLSVAPVPTVTAVSPSSGPTTGGTPVTVTGTGFSGATVVKFGTTAGTGLVVNSSTSISITSPAEAASTVDVTVTTPGGTSVVNAPADQFTYATPAPTVTGVSPSSGPTGGGTPVTITGTNLTGATVVNFGTTAGTGLVVNSSTSISVNSPAEAASTVDVTVTAPGGTSLVNAPADQFTYTASTAPTVTGVSPSSGMNGISVTVTGTNFTGVTAVDFGTGNPATFTVNSTTSISATSPAGTGTVDVTVTTTGGGTSATSTADNYTYVAGPPVPPTVSLVNPVTGPAGTLVTVSGTNFTGVTAVDFGLNAATFIVNSPTIITATAPSGTGAVDVTVTTGGGTSATSPSDQFTYSSGTSPVPVPSPVSGGWQLNGSAQLVTTTSPANLQLTAATNYEAGSAFWPTVVPGVGITAAFDDFIGSGTGADGEAFVIADASVTQPTALGINGGGEGFSGIKGIAVSLNTYMDTNYPSSNFVGIANGPGLTQDSLNFLTTNSSIPPLHNALHHFVVTTFSTGLTVTMDGTQVLNYATSLPSSVLVGFTGGTGGFNDVHQVQNVSITTGPPPPAPTVTGVSPSSGPTAGGTPVTITGTNLTGAFGVDFGGLAATSFSVGSDTSITATSPAGSAGTVDVKVATGGGTSGTNSSDRFSFTPPPPTVTAVSPTSGPSGTAVKITGTNLTGATVVDFGTGNPAIVFNVNSATSITATAPTGTGTVDVTVTTSGGTSSTSTADHYTYVVPPAPTVTAISPTSGPNGTPVTITGTNFTGVTAVDFGTGNPATFTVNSASSIAVTAPTGSGTVDVTVTTSGGTSATSTADEYTFVVPPAPAITSVSPSTGYFSSSVTVTGTNFTGASVVDFGTANPATTFTVDNDNTITVTAPAGTGTVDVIVTTSGGTSTTSPADNYTYLAGPPPPPTLVATYRGDLGRSGYYGSETGLTTANAASLKLHWTAKGGTGSFAQPIVANNLVYWGDWNGLEHGTSLTGTDVWTTNVGTNTQTGCSPVTAGPSGTATAGVMGGTPVLYVPGGNDNFYALNALTGAVIWKTNLGSQTSHFLWSSPILYNGDVYEGVASFGDCPLVQGQLVQLDGTNGSILHTFNTVASNCPGGGVWGSPAVDASDSSIYITTGNPSCTSPPNYAPAIVKVSASTLSYISSWNVPSSAQSAGDADFGSTPTLFTATIAGVPRSLVGALNKDGIFYAWDRTNLAAGPVWQSTIANASGSPLSIVSAVWDGSQLYVGGGHVTINGTACSGSIDALDPATGAFVWRNCVAGQMTAALTMVPGVIVEGIATGGKVNFVNTANGALLFTYSSAGIVQGEATVSNGVVYVPLGNGNLIALGQ
jgi:hypothetical protein